MGKLDNVNVGDICNTKCNKTGILMDLGAGRPRGNIKLKLSDGTILTISEEHIASIISVEKPVSKTIRCSVCDKVMKGLIKYRDKDQKPICNVCYNDEIKRAYRETLPKKVILELSVEDAIFIKSALSDILDEDIWTPDYYYKHVKKLIGKIDYKVREFKKLWRKSANI